MSLLNQRMPKVAQHFFSIYLFLYFHHQLKIRRVDTYLKLWVVTENEPETSLPREATILTSRSPPGPPRITEQIKFSFSHVAKVEYNACPT